MNELRCPYHQDLGVGSRRPAPRDSIPASIRPGCTNDDLSLVPVRVDTWARLVFVNLDLDAEPLDDWLEGIPADIAWANLDEFRGAYSTVTAVNCNWKVVNDGFSETYHVQGLHREMLASIDDVNTPQSHQSTAKSASYQAYGVAQPPFGPRRGRAGGVGTAFGGHAGWAHGTRSYREPVRSSRCERRRSDPPRRDRPEDQGPSGQVGRGPVGLRHRPDHPPQPVSTCSPTPPCWSVPTCSP